MLSIGAFNALLKTLEEPPEHVLFILATTELHKVPATILSRCQRFDFRRIGAEDISRRLLDVAAGEGIALTEGAARLNRPVGGRRHARCTFHARPCGGSRCGGREKRSRRRSASWVRTMAFAWPST